MAARPSSQAGSAHCTGAFMERKVSAITSSRARACSLPGPVATIHAAFICGSPAILLSPLTTKTGTPSSPAAKLRPAVRNPVVQKDLIHDEREVELPAQPRQLLGLPRLGKVAGRVVRVHQHDGPRLRGDGPPESLRLDLPAVVVDERNGPDAHIVKHRQEVEKRIARLRHQDLASRIAKQPEKEAVGLAGAGGQHDLAGIERNAVSGIVVRKPPGGRSDCPGAADRSRGPSDRSAPASNSGAY